MPNRGVYRGIGLKNWNTIPFETWIPYGPSGGESYPLLDAVTTTPNLGAGATQTARYCVIRPGIVIGYGQVFWGSGGNSGSGVYKVLLPPVGQPAQVGVLSGETVGWAELAGDSIGIEHMEEASLTCALGSTSGGVLIPANRAAVINPHRYMKRGSSTGAGFSVFGGENITHGLGLAPDHVTVTMTRTNSTPPIELTVSAINATTFTVAAQNLGDRVGIGDGHTTNGSAAVTSATIGFTKTDVGKLIIGTGIPNGTTISAVTDIQNATMSANATATNTNTVFTITSTNSSFPVSYPYQWQAWAPVNGTNGAGLFVTDSWPWTWGTQGQGIEWRFMYPLVGTQ